MRNPVGKQLAFIFAIPLSTTVSAQSLPQPDADGPFQAGAAAVSEDIREASVAASADSVTLTLSQAYQLAHQEMGDAAWSIRIDGNRISFAPGELIAFGDRIVLLSPGTPRSVPPPPPPPPPSPMASRAEAAPVEQEMVSADCEYCEGLLAVHYFERRKGRWVVSGAWLDTIQLSTTLDEAPGFRVEHRMLSVPVIVGSGISFQGQCVKVVDRLFALTGNGPIAVGFAPDGLTVRDEANAPRGAPWIASQISRYKRDWSFEVSYTGGSGGIPLDQSVTFQWTGSRFVPKQPLPTITGC